MNGIRSHIWFDNCADDAVATYTELFPDAQVGDRLTYPDTGQEVHGQEPGSTLTVDFTLAGRKFTALNGGPTFEVNPSISLAVSCRTAEEVDRLWAELARDGEALMPLDEYPWAPRYGWVKDRFGLTWQLMFAGEEAPDQVTVNPSFLFQGATYGRAEAAMRHWTEIFPDSKVEMVAHQEEGEAAGKVMFAEFKLAGESYNIMESELEHQFDFNEGFSLLIECESQAELDYYWDALTDGGAESQCGWLKDRFGVSWQASPVALQEMLRDGSPEQARRVMDAFMPMKKLDLAVLERAYGSGVDND